MNFVRLSEKYPETELNINSNKSESITVHQLQCLGDLKYDHSKGIVSNLSSDYLDGFFNIGCEINADLLLTPECSIPFDYLRKIIDNNVKGLEYNKLWCLCCEGVPYTEFRNYINELDGDSNIDLVCDLKGIDFKIHVNSIWYFFRTSEDKLVVVIQLKMFPMKDTYHEHEARDLTQGKTLYIFDLFNGSANQFVSLICADAIRIDKNSFLAEFSNKCLLVFNPQLNTNPKADNFRHFRQQLFSSNEIRGAKRYISLNWSQGTMLHGRKHIHTSGSGYYCNYGAIDSLSSIKDIEKSKRALTLREKAHAHGVYYSYEGNNHYNIWSFSNQQHIISYVINKYEVITIPENMLSKIDPIIINKHVYLEDKRKWEQIDVDCVDNKRFFGTEELLKSNLPYQCPENCSKKSCQLVQNDYFIALCFGGRCSKELFANNEILNRTIIYLCEGSKRKQAKKIKRLKKLFTLIEERNMPKTLKPMFENFKYDFNEKILEEPAYNVKFLDERYPYKKGIIAIMLEDCSISEVKNTYAELKSMTIKDYYQQIVLYYSEFGDGFQYYHEPYESEYSDKFTPQNPDYVVDTTSISKG